MFPVKIISRRNKEVIAKSTSAKGSFGDERQKVCFSQQVWQRMCLQIPRSGKRASQPGSHDLCTQRLKVTVKNSMHFKVRVCLRKTLGSSASAADLWAPHPSAARFQSLRAAGGLWRGRGECRARKGTPRAVQPPLGDVGARGF